MKIKEMKYVTKYTKEILCEDEYKGYHFIIISYGSHPCAYVKIPNHHPYYNKYYGDLDIEVHGGLTYGGMLNHIPGYEQNKTNWFIGWDYAHAGDYYAGLLDSPYVHSHDKKWSVHEIISEIQFVIKQLIRAEKEIKETAKEENAI